MALDQAAVEQVGEHALYGTTGNAEKSCQVCTRREAPAGAPRERVDNVEQETLRRRQPELSPERKEDATVDRVRSLRYGKRELAQPFHESGSRRSKSTMVRRFSAKKTKAPPSLPTAAGHWSR